MEKIHFIYTRFSQISRNQEWWRILKDKISFDEYIRMICDERRLLDRLTIFVKYQLPLLAMAAEKYHIFQYVASSIYLPELFRDALKAAESKYKFLKIAFFDEVSSFSLPVTCKHYLDSRGINNAFICTSRLDDDDILHPSFFDKMQKYMTDQFENYCVSFSCGYAGLFKDNQYHKFSPTRCVNIALGLSYINSYRNKQFTKPYLIPDCSHHIMDTANPVIVDGTFNAFVQSFHKNNGDYRIRQGNMSENYERAFFRNLSNFDEVNKYFYNIF